MERNHLPDVILLWEFFINKLPNFMLIKGKDLIFIWNKIDKNIYNYLKIKFLLNFGFP